MSALSRRSASERGMTLIEIMTAMTIMLIVMGGAMLIIVAAARSGRAGQERADMQRGGRAALALLGTQLGNAGLGLPRRLAILDYDAAEPRLTLAALDYRREWLVESTSEGQVTLASATPVVPSAADTAIPGDAYVFLYQNPSATGHALLRLGAERQAGTKTIAIGSTAAGSVQPAFDLDVPLPTGPHARVLLRAHTTTIGLDKTDPARPYLYLEEAGSGSRDPIAPRVESLAFAFYVDANCDGRSDDANANGVMDAADASATPFVTRVAPCDPAGATEVQVTAVEVRLIVKSEAIDPATGTYRSADFAQIIPTRNINTRASQYVFIDNWGLRSEPALE